MAHLVTQKALAIMDVRGRPIDESELLLTLYRPVLVARHREERSIFPERKPFVSTWTSADASLSGDMFSAANMEVKPTILAPVGSELPARTSLMVPGGAVVLPWRLRGCTSP